MGQLIPLPPYDIGVRTIFGPYLKCSLNGIKRKYVEIVYFNGERIGTTFSRFRMETYLGIKLNKKTHIHHKDGNTLNDNISNLEVLSDSEHQNLHHKINTEVLICPVCLKEFKLTTKQYTNKLKGRELRLFCSKSCNLKWQWNSNKYPIVEKLRKEYYEKFKRN